MKTYQCIIPISIFYITLKIITLLLLYKIVVIGSVVTTASSLIIPLWFVSGDIIAEVYGYKVAKQIIWSSLFAQLMLALTCALMIKLPSPPTWALQDAYDQVLGKLPRIAIASFFGISISALVNAKLLIRWKILLYGRYFFIRSFFASAIGELIFVLIAIFMEYYNVLPLGEVVRLIFVSYGLKLLISMVMVVPASILAILLKMYESNYSDENEISNEVLLSN